MNNLCNSKFVPLSTFLIYNDNKLRNSNNPNRGQLTIKSIYEYDEYIIKGKCEHKSSGDIRFFLP